MKKPINSYWEGKVVFKVKTISFSDYKRYMDDHISFIQAKTALEKLHDTVFALPADWMKKKYRDQVANYMVFGPGYFRYNYPVPEIEFRINCYRNGNKIKFYDLPVYERALIADDILENGKYYGRLPEVDICRITG